MKKLIKSYSIKTTIPKNESSSDNKKEPYPSTPKHGSLNDMCARFSFMDLSAGKLTK